MVVGAGLGFKLRGKPQTSVPVAAQSQESNCKAQVIRVTNPDGSKEERIEISSDSKQKQETVPSLEKKDDNLFFTSDLNEHGLYFKPDSLPLHIGVEYDRKDNEIKAKAGLSIRVDF